MTNSRISLVMSGIGLKVLREEMLTSFVRLFKHYKHINTKIKVNLSSQLKYFTNYLSNKSNGLVYEYNVMQISFKGYYLYKEMMILVFKSIDVQNIM